MHNSSRCSLFSFRKIPKYHPEPLTDDLGIYAYRMQRLNQLDFERLEQYRPKVTAVMLQVHENQLPIGDLHPGNVMLDDKGNIVLIDLSYASRLNEPVPPHVPQHVYGDSSLVHASDVNRRLEAHF
ncbi:hypothetical protein LTR74_017209 [Friedmanniomyces endolithicus]|nr:hypothetical protein LTR74_017209 [Friedmanniomyces endolithicus]